MEQWWQVILKAKIDDINLDEIGFELIELGAAGTELITQNQLKCFISGDEKKLNDFKQILNHFPIQLVSCETVPNINWVQKCSEVWHKLIIENITITPVMSLEDGLKLPLAEHNNFYIIPSCGFGTGHHATTNQATAILQSSKLNNIKRCLDIGTGSGLLAIIAHRLFNIPIDAIDNDGDAINNAKENAILNRTNNINIQQADAMTWDNGCYDLVIANLYAELLEKLHSRIYLTTNRWLLISGFHTPDTPELSQYDTPLWKRCDVRTTDGWTAMLLEKL